MNADGAAKVAEIAGAILAFFLIAIAIAGFIALIVWVVNATLDREHKWFE